MTFSERIAKRNANKEEYFKRFGHHYTTYGYFLLDSRKDDEVLEECLTVNKPLTEVLDAETLAVIRKAAEGEYTPAKHQEF
jgi:hypothetical protein